MKKTAIVYSFNSNKTAKIAEKILAEFNNPDIDRLNAETVSEHDLQKYDNLILGVPTWFDGELPTYWDELVPALEDTNFTGKTVALYGLGDQKSYPENFLDALGILANIFEKQGAKIVGQTSTVGYTFEKSKALINNQFLGLAIDFENEAHLNKDRVRKWVEQLINNWK